jgi:hypothetical protein
LTLPLTPSPSTTWPSEWAFNSLRYSSLSVMCLEHPLSKYQSSYEDSLRRVRAIRFVLVDLSFHTFLCSTFSTWISFFFCFGDLGPWG